MPNKDNPSPVDLSTIISRLFVNCTEKETRHAQKFGVSIVEFRCLRILYEQKTLTVNQLAQKMSLTSSRVTRIIDGLVEKKLVNREGGEADRRIYNLSLTTSSMKLTAKMIQEYYKMHSEILNNIPVEIQQQMLDMLTQLNCSVEKWLQK